jgi:hypothetical protein
MINFGEDLYNHLSTILERSVGLSLDIRQIDRLRIESNKLAEAITRQVEKIAQERALQVCKLLNEATKSGFEAVGAQIDALRPPVKGQDPDDVADHAAKVTAAVDVAVEAVTNLIAPPVD